MKCFACYSEIADGAGKCPVCGFTIPRRIGNTETYEQMMQEIAAEYRRTHMIAAKIGIMVYYYSEAEDGKLVQDEKEVTLCENITQLTRGEVYWNSQNFGVLDAGTPITLKLFRRMGDDVRFWEVSLKAPDTEGFWKVGIRVEDGLRLRVLVGDEKNFSESESVSLAG